MVGHMQMSSTLDIRSDTPDLTKPRTVAKKPKTVLNADLFMKQMNLRGAKTPAEAAVLLDMNRTHLLDFLAGRKTPSLPVGIRLAKGALMHTEDLFTERAA